MNLKAISLVLIGILLSVAFLGCAEPEEGCTAEAKVCPDGSNVGRNPELGCEFNPCPGEEVNADDIPMPEDTGGEGAIPEFPI